MIALEKARSCCLKKSRDYADTESGNESFVFKWLKEICNMHGVSVYLHERRCVLVAAAFRCVCRLGAHCLVDDRLDTTPFKC
jgi:hypothetical protein